LIFLMGPLVPDKSLHDYVTATPVVAV